MLCASDVEGLVRRVALRQRVPCLQGYLDHNQGRCIASTLHKVARDVHRSRHASRHPKYCAPWLTEECPRNQRECHGDGGNDKPDVCLACDLFASRVESHVSSIAVEAPNHARSA